MVAPSTSAAQLIQDAELAGCSVRLLETGKINLVAPNAQTYDAVAKRITSQRPEVVAALKSRCRRCGSFTWIEVPIHGGRSVRCDCRGLHCHAFIRFAKWYGEEQ